MKKPIIGISGSILIDQGGMFPGYKRAYVNNDYVEAVVNNDGVPFIIPFNENEDIIDAQISCIDGLILSGGHDVDPANYGEEPSTKLGEIFPKRDEFDFRLLKKAKEKGIPILGICRGNQVINVYEGGDLYQDLSDYPTKVVKHWQAHTPDLAVHTVEFEKDSIISSICKNKDEIRVNSFHHQAIKTVAKDYKVTARAKDGVIECIENTKYPFLVGIQWHPEMRFRVDEDMNAIFKKLIDLSRQK